MGANMAALVWTCLERGRSIPEILLLVNGSANGISSKTGSHLHVISEIVILFSICLLSNLAGIPRDVSLSQVFITKSEGIIIISRLSFHSFSRFSHVLIKKTGTPKLISCYSGYTNTADLTDHWSGSPLSWIGCAVRCRIRGVGSGGVLCWVRLRNIINIHNHNISQQNAPQSVIWVHIPLSLPVFDDPLAFNATTQLENLQTKYVQHALVAWPSRQTRSWYLSMMHCLSEADWLCWSLAILTCCWWVRNPQTTTWDV